MEELGTMVEIDSVVHDITAREHVLHRIVWCVEPWQDRPSVVLE